jgi:hypothetical protein
MVAWAALSIGCFSDAPTFAPRGQIPPFMVTGQAEPPLGAVYKGPIPFPINVPFRSEDVNFPLLARLYPDLVPGADQSTGAVEKNIPAGIYEDTTRSVSMEWSTPLEGCHSLTLILTYLENLDASGFPLDDARAARVVWWLNVDDVDGVVTMASCPGASQR